MKQALVTSKTLSRLFNLTERRIQQLAREETIPKADKGKYNLIECVQSYIKFLQDRSNGKHNKDSPDYIAERTRLTKAQADKVELELAVLEQSLIPAALVEEVWSKMIASSKAKLLSVPLKAAQTSLGKTELKEVEDINRTFIYEALEELSEFDEHHYEHL